MCTDEETNDTRTWWLILGIVLMTGIAGFFFARPFDNGEINTNFVLLAGVINIFMVSVIGMALWRFYTTAWEERIVVTRKYVIVVLIALAVKYIYLTSVQNATLTRCVPNMLEECRKEMEEADYSPLMILTTDLFVFSAASAVGVFLIQNVLDPIDREGFTGWLSRFVKPKDDGVKLNDVKTKLQDVKTMDIDITEMG
ncbi:uncharacterized protein LOC110441717 isoform X2 [Mizuhopecten yessoensis]|uniref:uncharacterized protein LOC110441717 isoform X2 n=1 Tax=Mizuhopecten yessoensis TaxID=6573 RepID=UPI000B45F154|nr:uncharacterized protein LOC110441717 isoform X2 [Mizuhopecten yessoensis]